MNSELASLINTWATLSKQGNEVAMVEIEVILRQRGVLPALQSADSGGAPCRENGTTTLR